MTLCTDIVVMRWDPNFSTSTGQKLGSKSCSNNYYAYYVRPLSLNCVQLTSLVNCDGTVIIFRLFFMYLYNVSHNSSDMFSMNWITVHKLSVFLLMDTRQLIIMV